MTTTTSQWVPHTHNIIGRRGDSLPAWEIVMAFTMPDEVDATEWTALAQIRKTTALDSPVLHAWTVTLEDMSDDDTLDPDQLQVTLTPLTGAESFDLYPDLPAVWDLQLTRDGEQPLTWVHGSVSASPDVSREVAP